MGCCVSADAVVMGTPLDQISPAFVRDTVKKNVVYEGTHVIKAPREYYHGLFDSMGVEFLKVAQLTHPDRVVKDKKTGKDVVVDNRYQGQEGGERRGGG